jgi:hypothetical protein
MTPAKTNISLVVGVVALAASAFFSPRVSDQPLAVRLLCASFVASGLGLLVYNTLWVRATTSGQVATANQSDTATTTEPSITADQLAAELVVNALDPVDVHVEIRNIGGPPVYMQLITCTTASFEGMDVTPVERRLAPQRPMEIKCWPFMFRHAENNYEMDLVVRYGANPEPSESDFQTGFRFGFRRAQLQLGARIQPTAIANQRPSTGTDRVAAIIAQLRDERIGTIHLPLRAMNGSKPNVVRIPAGTKFFLFDPVDRVVRFQMVTNDGRRVALALPITSSRELHDVVIVWDVNRGAVLRVDGAETSEMAPEAKAADPS